VNAQEGGKRGGGQKPVEMNADYWQLLEVKATSLRNPQSRKKSRFVSALSDEDITHISCLAKERTILAGLKIWP